MRVQDRSYIFEAAKKQWGEKSQVIAAAEEFAEAAVVMCQYANGKRPVDSPDIITELADAEIMCEQMRHYFNGALIDAEKTRKLRRLAEHLGIIKQLWDEDNER